MIRLEVKEYCGACEDFSPDITKPEKLVVENSNFYEYKTDTIVRCKNAKRCEAIKRYLESNKSIKE